MSPRAVKLCHVAARSIAAVVFGVGLCGLLGWTINNQALKGAFAGGITIKANATIGLIIVGIALWIRNKGENSIDGPGRISRVCGLVSGALGGLTFLEHVTGLNFGIDQLFFQDLPGALATASPGRMGPSASLSFLLAGIALSRRKQGTGTQLMAVIVAKDAGGETARRLVIPMFLLPIVVWWLRLQVEELGWIDTPLVRPLAVLFLSVSSVVVLFVNARRMSGLEKARVGVERERLREYARNAEILESVSDAF